MLELRQKGPHSQRVLVPPQGRPKRGRGLGHSKVNGVKMEAKARKEKAKREARAKVSTLRAKAREVRMPMP